jgi:alpha-beta hydrolase superfamily lysophospholipase
MSEAAVSHRESTIQSADGTKLGLRRCSAAGPIQAEVLIVHGYADHGGRYREVSEHLARAGLGVTAVDLRGHGRSDGQRGYIASFLDYHADVAAGLGTLDAALPHFILAHSMGAMLSLDYVSQKSPKLAGLVVTNPFLALAAAPPKAKLLVGKAAAFLAPRLSLPSGLDPAHISRDPATQEAYREDPLVFTTANAAWFRECGVAQERVRALKALPVPLLFAYSLTDPIASGEAHRALAAQLESPDKTVVERDGLHEILNETNRAELHDKIRDWILSRARGAG